MAVLPGLERLLPVVATPSGFVRGGENVLAKQAIKDASRFVAEA